MNTISRTGEALALATLISACGAAPLTQEEQAAQAQARADAQSAARFKQIKATAGQCASSLLATSKACKSIPDDPKDTYPEANRNECKVNARNTFRTCLDNAGKPAKDAYDTIACTPIGAAKNVCAESYNGADDMINRDLCVTEAEDSETVCMHKREPTSSTFQD